MPPGPLPSMSPLQDWSRPAETGLRATWLGHSTVLLEVDGFRVLTDPVWGERASPVTFAGPKRFQPVPVSIAELPPLDAVVISHDHYDHLDHPTILELARVDVPFVTSLGVGAHLEAWGVPAARIIELDWWERADLPGGLTITAAPSQHFSGRGIHDRNSTLWSSLVVRGSRHAVFFSGDTGLTPEYTEIRDRLGPFDLVMLEVGAFHPAWGDIHLGPEHALEALELLGGGNFLPVHLGHVQPRAPRLGRSRRDAPQARARPPRAPRHASPRRTGRAGARRERDAVVARGGSHRPGLACDRARGGTPVPRARG